MGFREDEIRWKRLQNLIAAEASGRTMQPTVSQRTLFGIPSTVEKVIAQTVAHDEKERRMRRQANQEFKHVVHSIDPVYDERSRILVLGSLPSPKSRETGFFYGHPQNRFWRVLSELFDEPVATTNERKRDQLLRHHIALWDVLASCDIEGASDASIRNAVPNDLSPLFSQAELQGVFCTGTKAAELYTRLSEPATGVPCTRLPSTSPANAASKLSDLVDAYSSLLPHLKEFTPPAMDVADVVALEKAIDASGTSLSELMDRAGCALAFHVHRKKPRARVVVLCGNGNNGGDGWVAARELVALGHKVTLVTARTPGELRAEPAREAALAAEQRILRESVRDGGRAETHSGARVLLNPDSRALASELGDADVIVDALLGTGFTGKTVKEPFGEWIELANERRSRGALVIAADVPSGLNAQTGDASAPCVRADETVTMIVSKTGLEMRGSAHYTGAVSIAPLAYIEPLLAR